MVSIFERFLISYAHGLMRSQQDIDQLVFHEFEI